MTKHCAQFKQAVLQIPLSGCTATTVLTGRLCCLHNTGDNKNTAEKEYFMYSNQIYILLLFLISKKGSSLFVKI
jgi:hypothetical protein